MNLAPFIDASYAAAVAGLAGFGLLAWRRLSRARLRARAAAQGRPR